MHFIWLNSHHWFHMCSLCAGSSTAYPWISFLCGSNYSWPKMMLYKTWNAEVKQQPWCPDGHCWVWGETIQWVPVCPYPSPLEIQLPAMMPNGNARPITRCTAVDSQRWQLWRATDPSSQSQGRTWMCFNSRCPANWLIHQHRAFFKIFNPIFRSLLPHLCLQLHKIQSPYWLLLFLLFITDAEPFSEPCLMCPWTPALVFCSDFDISCWDVLISDSGWTSLCFSFMGNLASSRPSLWLWTSCPGNGIVRYCFPLRAHNLLSFLFSPSVWQKSKRKQVT